MKPARYEELDNLPGLVLSLREMARLGNGNATQNTCLENAATAIEGLLGEKLEAQRRLAELRLFAERLLMVHEKRDPETARKIVDGVQ